MVGMVRAMVGMVPKAIKEKDIKKESTNVTKKSTSKPSTVLVKMNAPPDVKEERRRKREGEKGETKGEEEEERGRRTRKRHQTSAHETKSGY